MNTLQTGCPSKGFNFSLSSCLLARGERKLSPVIPWPCWSDVGAGLGSSSYSAQICQTQGDWHLSPHQDHPQVATVSCFSTACPAFQSWGLARQCPGHGASLSSLIHTQLWDIVDVLPLPSKTPQWSSRRKAACGWWAPGSLALQEEGSRLSYTILQ